jgi:hypothetical protein
MSTASKAEKNRRGYIIPIDAVITTCSNRKTQRPKRSATPSSLPKGTQRAVETAWREKIRKLPLSVSADEFYAGRAFGLAVETARMSNARLYVLSAGLGLLPAERPIPVYGLTVSEGHTESVASKVLGEFDPAAWFSRLLSWPISDDWQDVAKRKSGRILVAMSRPYAEMVGESLSRVPPKMFGRLRIFGASLETVLPVSLRPAIAPYDERLNVIFPGTRSDFSQRAMLHFARSIAVRPSAGREADFAAVTSALRNLPLPKTVRRPRLSDEEIVALISKRLRMQSGAARMLAALRHDEGVACEQSRFGRLYRIASGKGAVS